MADSAQSQDIEKAMNDQECRTCLDSRAFLQH